MVSSLVGYNSLVRQVNHWLQAATRMSQIENLASSYAWFGIGHKLANLLRESLKKKR